MADADWPIPLAALLRERPMKERRVWKLTYPRNNRYGVGERVGDDVDVLAEISAKCVELGGGDPTNVESAHTVWVDDRDAL